MDEKEFQGLIGESLTYRLLNDQINIYKQILSDVKIKVDEEETQIDNILITSKKIYVIENKSWKGIIEDDKFGNIYQILSEKKLVDINPIKQNNYHIYLLSKKLNIEIENFKSIIVMGYHANLKINYKHDACIIKIENLISTINQDILYSKDIFSHEMVDDIYMKLKNNM